MKALWKDLRGNSHVITGDNMEEIQETINALRESMNLPKPDFMAVETKDETVDVGSNGVHIDELPKDLQEEIKEAIEERRNSMDPKDMN